MIRAPFNFIPLPNHIFYPDWDSEISQDVPIKKDFTSGTIVVKITALTPIFVRNGYSGIIKDNSFSKYPNVSDKKTNYFIPATTLKGCIRELVEIMGFGKIKTERKDTISYRKSNGDKITTDWVPWKIEDKRQEKSSKYQNKNKENLDLAECIFGTTDKENSGKKLCLRGRVHFSHIKCDKEVCMSTDETSITLALNGPKPSYYPLYLTQKYNINGKLEDKNSSYNVYNENAVLNGWKRYVLRNGIWKKTSQDNDNVNSVLHPLNRGSEFTGKIIFHNLRREELGALLSALTFHGKEGTFHQIGQGKPYGLGKVKLEIISLDIDKNSKTTTFSECIQAFEQLMDMHIKSVKPNDQRGWIKSSVIQELFELASASVDSNDIIYQYMELEIGKDGKTNKNEFNDAKKAKETLIPFSKHHDTKKYYDTQKERPSWAVAETDQSVIEKQSPLKLEIDAIVENAKVLFEQKNFHEALDLYQKADDYNIESFKPQIELCKIKIREIEALNGDISDFLNTFSIASVPAFARKLINRKKPITDADVPFIIEKLNSGIAALSNKNKKDYKWFERNKWKPIEDILGEELTNVIYSHRQK